jgi:hypothetical protein
MKADRKARSMDGLRRMARLFDAAFRIPGTQITFGLDPLLGLVPGVGDLASPLLTIWILWQGATMRVPKIVLSRMVLNALIDAGVGAIPVLGDAFDFAWKSNEWNMALLERHVMPGGRATSGDYLFVTLCVLVVIAAALLPILAAWLALTWLRSAFTH